LQPNNQTDSLVLTQVSTFPKSSRLRKRADFVVLSNSTNKHTVKGFLVIWNLNSYGIARLGITATKKTGSAVGRNKIKRRIREVFRHRRLSLPAVDINIVVRRDASVMDFQSFEIELEKAFRRIGAST